MPQTNQELIRKFEQVARWMIDDTKRAIYPGRANFLVAQALLNYTEIIGSFIEPTSNSTGVKFDPFFSRMGDEYRELLRRHNGLRGGRGRRILPNGRPPGRHVVYDDLRCGLSHEYAIKRKKFIIYNHDANHELTDAEINNLGIDINGARTRCIAGVMHSTEHRKGVWHVIDPKYWLDFKTALEQYILEIQNPRNRDLRRNFFMRARQINFIEFS